MTQPPSTELIGEGGIGSIPGESNAPPSSFAAAIRDRGRGPEIVGTRVTIYRIMDFLRDNSGPQDIADALNLTPEQVKAALRFIAEHRESLETEYEEILRRGDRTDHDADGGDLPASAADFLRVIAERLAAEGAHDRPGGP